MMNINMEWLQWSIKFLMKKISGGVIKIKIRILLCVIDIFIKYALVIPLKDKKGITMTNVFQKNLIGN